MSRVEYWNDPGAPAPNSLVPACGVLAVDGQGRVLLQRRRDTGQWALPMGKMELGETPSGCAIRETREETGLTLAGERVVIQRYLPSNGGSDESVTLFCGRVDSTVAGGVHGLPAEHEDIRVVVKTLAEVEAMLDAGTIESGHTLIALYWLLRHRDHLRKQWAAS